MSKKAGIWLMGTAMLILAAGPVLGQEFVDVSKQAGVADDGLGKGVAAQHSKARRAPLGSASRVKRRQVTD